MIEITYDNLLQNESAKLMQVDPLKWNMIISWKMSDVKIKLETSQLPKL